MIVSNSSTVNVNINDNEINVDIHHILNKQINIFKAIESHDIEQVNAYINAGGDINIKNMIGFTPIVYAIKEGWNANEIADFLKIAPLTDIKLIVGCSKNSNINEGNAFEVAIKHKEPDILKILIDYNSGITISDFNCPMSKELQMILAKNLDYSNLINYKYGDTFGAFKEAGFIYSALLNASADEDFYSIFEYYKEFNLSSAARKIAFGIFCNRVGYESEEVEQLIKEGFFDDFIGYLLHPSHLKAYDNSPSKQFQFYASHIEDLDLFIEQFNVLNEKHHFSQGIQFLEILYEIRCENSGPLEDNSGTVTIGEVLIDHNSKIIFDDSNIPSQVNIHSCVGNNCINVGVNILEPHLIIDNSIM